MTELEELRQWKRRMLCGLRATISTLDALGPVLTTPELRDLVRHMAALLTALNEPSEEN